MTDKPKAQDDTDRMKQWEYEWNLIKLETWLGKKDFIKFYGKTKEELLNEKYPKK